MSALKNLLKKIHFLTYFMDSYSTLRVDDPDLYSERA